MSRHPGRPPPDVPLELLGPLVMAFVQAPSWPVSRVFLEHHPELLGEATDGVLAWMVADARSKAGIPGFDQARQRFEQHRALLDRCRAIGVDAAFRELLGAGDWLALGELRIITGQADAAWQRWEEQADPDALDAAVCLYGEAAAHPGLASAPEFAGDLLATTGDTLLTRYKTRDRAADLDGAIQFLDAAVERSPSHPADLPALLVRLGLALTWRGAGRADYDRAVAAFERALGLVFSERLDQAIPLQGLGTALLGRYPWTGDPQDLQRATAALEQAVALTPESSPARPEYLRLLGHALLLRHEALGDPGDIERSVEVLGTALSAVGGDPFYQDSLGSSLLTSQRLSGREADLDRAVDLLERAVAATPDESPDLPGRLHNLASAFRGRYKCSGDLTDLDRAVGLAEHAVANSPAGPGMARYRYGLASGLLLRYEHHRTPADLDRGIENAQASVDETPVSSQELAARVSVLGGALRLRFERTGQQRDLELALTTLDHAVSSTPLQDPSRGERLGNLGVGLMAAWFATGERRWLDQAVDTFDEAARESREETSRAAHLGNLAGALTERHVAIGASADQRRAVQAYRESCRVGLVGNPEVVLRCGQGWGDWAAGRRSWHEAEEAYDAALEALGGLVGAQLTREHKEAWLRAASVLPPRAAYAHASASNGEKAVTALERGRALLLTEALRRDRVELDRLVELGRGDLLDRYRSAADALANQEGAASATARPWSERTLAPEALSEAARAARNELEAVVNEIRQLPGYDRFLELPTFVDVAAAARPYPLVYLACTGHGGVGLIVTAASRPRVAIVWLPDLTEDALAARVRDLLDANAESSQRLQSWLGTLDEVTAWLWHAAVGPLLAALPPGERISLVPAGLLGLLPLHAAWTRDDEASSGRRYALDELAMGYAPNGQALLEAQRVAGRAATDGMLAIEQPEPVSASPLPGAGPEVAGALGWFGAGHMQRLGGKRATRQQVLAALAQFPVFHFACHGTAEPANPLDSGLLLARNERLTLGDLLGQRLWARPTGGARLAVLSACDSGAIGIDLPDEVVGLPAGLLQAGMGGVVASLWPVVDRSTMVLMLRFYQLWRGDGMEPTEALRQAQRWVRDTNNGEKAAAFPDIPGLAGPSGDENTRQFWASSYPYQHPGYWAAFAYVGA